MGPKKDLGQRYDRQIVIPEIGVCGHQRLRKSTALVAGCGGLGSCVIPVLAAAGVGRLILCDDDTVKVSNLNRQTLFRETTVGEKKVDVAAQLVMDINSDVVVEKINTAIGPQNFDTMLEGVDIVIDCVDRLAVKLFLNDACILKSTALVHCVAIGFSGEIMSILPDAGPCYRCFFEGTKVVSTDLNCANAGIISSTVSAIGGIAASETIKYLVGISPQHLGKLYRIDLLSNTFDTYRFAQNPLCSSCGSKATVDPYDKEGYEGKLRL